MYYKNRSRLAKSIFDDEDITKGINEMPIDLPFKYCSELISKPSIPVNYSFFNDRMHIYIYIYIYPIMINDVKSCYSTLHECAPGIHGLKNVI